MLRRLLPVPVAALLLVLTAACGANQPPQVTFAAGQASVVAPPTQYCDLEMTDCRKPAPPVTLDVPAGTPLRVEVPEPVASAPWHVVFSYRDAADQRVDGRSPLFAASERNAFTLELPVPTAHLLEAQVQQFGPAPQMDPETGKIEFPVRASWVIRTS